MDLVWGGAGFLGGILFTKGLDMIWDWFKLTRTEKREEERENQAVDIAEEALKLAQAQSRQEGHAYTSYLPYFREHLRNETHVYWGAMDPRLDGENPATTPGATMQGTTTAAP